MENVRVIRKLERLKFKRDFRLQLIDTAERKIEHFKSMIKNYKAQNKEFNREIAKEYDREMMNAGVARLSHVGTTGTMAII